MRFDQGNEQVVNTAGSEFRGNRLVLFESLYWAELQVVREAREKEFPKQAFLVLTVLPVLLGGTPLLQN